MTQEEFNYWLNRSENFPRDIKWKAVPLEYKEFVDCNILGVSIGTTGYKGGDTGHGGRTIFSLTNVSSTDMRVSINDGEVVDADSIKIIFGGDAEMDTFTKALMFAAEYMRGKTSTTPWYKRLIFKFRMLWWKFLK